MVSSTSNTKRCQLTLRDASHKELVLELNECESKLQKLHKLALFGDYSYSESCKLFEKMTNLRDKFLNSPDLKDLNQKASDKLIKMCKKVCILKDLAKKKIEEHCISFELQLPKEV